MIHDKAYDAILQAPLQHPAGPAPAGYRRDGRRGRHAAASPAGDFMKRTAGPATGLDDYSKAATRQARADRTGPPRYGDGTLVGCRDLTPEGRILYFRPLRKREHGETCGKRTSTEPGTNCTCLEPWRLVVISEPYDGRPARLVRPSATSRVPA